MFRGGKRPKRERIINIRRVHSVGVLDDRRGGLYDGASSGKRGGAWEDEDISDLAGERCV